MKCAQCQTETASEFHYHHIQYRSENGSDDPNNLQYLCKSCHIQLHSLRGDFAVWGRLGGRRQRDHLTFLRTLKQFRDHPERQQQWLQKHAPERVEEFFGRILD